MNTLQINHFNLDLKRVFYFMGLLVVAYLLFFSPDLWAAGELKKPSFISSNGKQELDDAGARAYEIIGIIAGIVVAVAGVVGAVIYAAGNQELGTKIMKGTLIGAIAVTVIGGIAIYISGS